MSAGETALENARQLLADMPKTHRQEELLRHADAPEVVAELIAKAVEADHGKAFVAMGPA